VNPLSGPTTPTKPRIKKSTVKGEGRRKLIAALTLHHQYAKDSCLNQEPIGVNELARLAEVSTSTSSAFFEKEFGEHSKYIAICLDPSKLVASLKMLNAEYSPVHVFGTRPPRERNHEDE
jgi:hypothetical protein